MPQRYSDKDNEAILAKIADYLTFTPDAITPNLIAEMRSASDLSEEDAFAHLLAALTDQGSDDERTSRELYAAYFRPMVKKLDYAAFSTNPYLTSMRNYSVIAGNWTLRQKTLKAYEAFPAGELMRLPDGRVLPQIGFFDRTYHFPALFEGKREWMEITPNEIITIEPAIETAWGNVLTYGLGLGYFAFMASRRAEVSRVTIVERDADAISLFTRHILPHFANANKVRVIQDDAFHYQATRARAERYNVIFTDLWHDAADGIPLMNRMKALEHVSPESQYLYWIEDTLKLYEGA